MMVTAMLASLPGAASGRGSIRGRRKAPRREKAFLFKAEEAVPADSFPNASSTSEEEAKKMWLEKLNKPYGAGTSARPTVKRGKVKFYKEDKGWGYIQPEKKGEIDVFVHYSSIKKDGWRSLMPGEPVEYTVVIQSDGRVACGTVTGPDGADVQGCKPDALSTRAERFRVPDWVHTVDGVVIPVRNPLIEEYEDEIFDDTIYLEEEDYFSN
jgi:CspA family cold shock protein